MFGEDELQGVTLADIAKARKDASDVMELNHGKASRLMLCCHLDERRPHLWLHTATNSSLQRHLCGLTSFLALMRFSLHSFCYAIAM